MERERAVGGRADVGMADVRACDEAHQREDDVGVGRG